MIFLTISYTTRGVEETVVVGYTNNYAFAQKWMQDYLSKPDSVGTPSITVVPSLTEITPELVA